VDSYIENMEEKYGKNRDDTQLLSPDSISDFEVFDNSDVYFQASSNMGTMKYDNQKE